MAAKRMNILVYSGGLTNDEWRKNPNLMVSSGNGSTVESVRHCLYTLRRLLAPNYAVIPVTGDMIIKEPWTASCAALVFPGGADLGYCRTLNGEGNRRIRRYVEQGGIYIGFCAGGYYGSSRCEFEVGNKVLEVIGSRELAFYPGTCRGCAFPGFVYHSEKGARAAELKVDKSVLSAGSVPNVFKSYYNGGGVFVDALKYREKGIEVLATYTEDIAVDGGDSAAAIIYCKVGEGAAMLTGPHPEFVFFGKPADDWSLTKPRYAAANIEKQSDRPEFERVVDILSDDEKHRMDFLKACLTKLGLEVSDEQNVPSLSRIHLSSAHPPATGRLISTLEEVTTNEDGEEYLKDDNDTFHIVKPSTWTMLDLKESLPSESEPDADQAHGSSSSSDRIVDYNTIVKQVLVHDSDHPAPKDTPYFNHHAYYVNLAHYQSTSSSASSTPFGTPLLYGEVVTSTNTLLEKNTALLRRLSTGFTATATVQLAGRGRGSNVWVSPAGSLLYSTVIRHPMSAMSRAPVVFVQYLAAMAVVEAVKSYDGTRYEAMPLKLKWPNDIYALLPGRKESEGAEAYTKIGGILVNSQYNQQEYIMVCGVGINTSNTAPSTSLNALVAALPGPKRQPFTLEKLLARIMVVLEGMYARFLSSGFDERFLQEYYGHWLHMDQVVSIESEGGARARIKGITGNFGLLVAEELGWEDRATGRRWELQSDSNSFDFFRGLLRRKV